LKRLLFGFLLFVLVLGVVEGTSRLLLRSAPDLDDRIQALATGHPTDVRERARGRIGHRLPGGGFLKEVIHPYLGFAVEPPVEALEGPLTLESLGFPLGGPLVRERRPDRLVVAVFGGSVAAYFVKAGGPQRLFEGLQSVPRFQGRELVVLGAAHLGYKQPQSLMALAYLEALGAELDLVILLDGFNEVVGPPMHLIPSGVFPFFPGHWSQRVADLDAAVEMRSLIGEIAFLNEERARWAERLLGSSLRASGVARLAWALWDRRLETRLEARRRALDAAPRLGRFDYTASGPPFRERSDDELYRELAAVWAESALQMRALAESDGALFFHFLQPNQHLPGSKPIGEEEAAVALRGGESFDAFVRLGYTRLRERGTELRARGVHFHDLTQVFAEVREPLYVDNIGHLGPRGNQLLADAMAAAIRADLEAADGGHSGMSR
jgi:hypothetical protein